MKARIYKISFPTLIFSLFCYIQTANAMEIKKVYIQSQDGKKSEFNVEIATTSEEKEHGLMFRKEMPKDNGMLFLFDKPQVVNMWMKNTLLPLDMIFIDEKNRIASIAANTEPLSTKIISSEVRIVAVLEINAMLCNLLSIKEGDLFVYK